MNMNTQNVTRLLEQALADAVAGEMVAVTIALVDQDGGSWLYRWAALPGDEPTRPVMAATGRVQ